MDQSRPHSPALARGDRVDAYEILSLVGVGGMGEVYRARDTRLGREVAIKTIRSSFGGDRERLDRFEQEARVAGLLNHPNLLVIFDIGTHEGRPYLVSELLEGETLRQRMGTALLSTRTAVELAVQVAHGLSAAHRMGIVHRDLKPENLFITRDERVKILDFGLAKLTRALDRDSDATGDTLLAHTRAGVVLGTVGYMAPEQVRGEVADNRSDIFAFGAVLHEMLSGHRTFEAGSVIETMNAILTAETPDLPGEGQHIPLNLGRIVRRCLEKSPEQRFQTASDLAFALSSLSGLGSVGSGAVPSTPSAPSFHRLTFRRGMISSARFAPEGYTIVYGAAWDGGGLELYSTRQESPESRSLGVPASLLAISPQSEMAILLESRFMLGEFVSKGTLARAPLAGGAPRELLEDVEWADWAPAGSGLAVVCETAGVRRLEFPIGRVLYETNGYIDSPRVSPRGNCVAFLEYTRRHALSASVVVVGVDGSRRILSGEWFRGRGLAWSADGSEIWLTSSEVGGASALHALDLSGEDRLVARMDGRVTLHDISREGRVLLTRDTMRVGTMGCPPGETRERNLSWLDGSFASDLSEDGLTLVITEAREGGGARRSVYMRRMLGSEAVRLGEGGAFALSPDGRWVLTHLPDPASRLVLLPTRAGEPRPVELDCESDFLWADWFPDGERILIACTQTGQRARCYVHRLGERGVEPMTPEGVTIPSGGHVISPDGAFVAAIDADRRVALYPVAGGDPVPLPGLAPRNIPIRWSADARSLYVYRGGELPVQVYRLDVETQRKTLWREFAPLDPAGISEINPVLVTPDGGAYVYSFERALSDLYLVEGLT